MALILTPIPFLALLTIFIVVVAISKYVSLGSVTAAILYPVIANAYINIFLSYKAPGVLSICTVLLAIFIVWLHRANMVRLAKGTENKIGKNKPNKLK
jgi:glycerol-3-phosphate acyltransferase PlsY